MDRIKILVGTRKGAFILRSDAARQSWTVEGPHCQTWPVNHVIGDPADGTLYAAAGNEWFGPAVWKSTDGGATWTHSSKGLAYPEGQTPVKSAWSLASAHGRLWCGVEPAGLFYSDDGGETWEHVPGLTDHPSRPDWQPGGGGLILHHIVVHPHDPGQLWVGISSAGVFWTGDGGRTWEPRNSGVRCDYLPEDQRYPEYGQCVHGIALAPGNPDRIYQQNHCGMYRSDDGGRHWQSIENGLPSSFGFPVAVHPRDPDRVYLAPLNGDSVGRYMPEGRAAVWRSGDRGTTWRDLRRGLPQGNAFINVLRQGLATDSLEPAGVYMGTGDGTLFASRDEGETWDCVAQHLPTITSVETLVERG